MKKFFIKFSLFCIIFLALSSCKAFRLSTENTTIEVESAESAHIGYLSIICADDTSFGV